MISPSINNGIRKIKGKLQIARYRENLCIKKMRLQFWEMESNKVEDELSSPDMHIHLSQSTELYHQEQALSHRLMTAKEVSSLARLCIINIRKDASRVRQ